MRPWPLALVALLVALARPAPDRAALAAPAAFAAPQRIVSLTPALTEDLFAIGAGPRVVGVSSYSNYPPAARRLPIVASAATTDVERIVALRPDLVVASGYQLRLVAPLRRAGLRVAFVEQTTYEDIFGSIARLGALTGREPAAAALVRSLRARTAALVRRVPPGPRPSVFYVVEVSPLYTAGDGSFIARLLELAGARDAVGRLRLAYAPYGAEALVALQPDVVMGDDAAALRPVLGRPPWSDLAAVRAGRVDIIGDADLLVRPGPRYVDGLAWLIARLHPAPGTARGADRR